MDFLASNKPGPYSGLSTPSDNPSFPELYTFEDAIQEMALTSDDAPLLGVTGYGDTLAVDFESESPHVLISGATGGCKSSIARTVAAQGLADGAILVILDRKQHSHTWARNLPNVHYADTLPLIGDMLVKVGQELKSRNEYVKELKIANLDNDDFDADSIDVGPRIIILFEEMNATMEVLQKLTRQVFKNSNEFTAIDAFESIMFMGRTALTSLVAVAQFADVKAMGGSAIRENFNTRILVNYTPNAWNMLAWDCGYAKARPSQIGRGYVCRAGKAKETQFLYLTEREARKYVQSRLSPTLTLPATPTATAAI